MADTGRYDVDINHNFTSQTGASRNNTVELSPADRSRYDKLLNEFGDLKKLLGGKLGSTIATEIAKQLGKAGVSGKQLGAVEAISNSAISSAIQLAISRSQKQHFGSSPKGSGTDAFSNPATFVRILQQQLEAVINQIFARIEKQGIQLDAETKRALRESVTKKVSDFGNKETNQTLKDLNSTVKNATSLISKGMAAFNQAKKLATSDNRIDLSELKPLIELLKSGSSDIGKVMSDIKNVTAGIKKLPDAYKESFKGMEEELSSLRKSLQERVGTVRRSIDKDPMGSFRDLSQSLAAEIKKSMPGIADSKAVRALERASEASKDYKNVEKALNEVAAHIEKLAAKGDFSVLKGLPTLVDKVKSVADAFPSDFKIQSNIDGPAWSKFTDKLSTTVNKVKEATEVLTSAYEKYQSVLGNELNVKITHEAVIDDSKLKKYQAELTKNPTKIPAVYEPVFPKGHRPPQGIDMPPTYQQYKSRGTTSPFTKEENKATGKDLNELFKELIDEVKKFNSNSKTAGPLAPGNTALAEKFLEELQSKKGSDVLEPIRSVLKADTTAKKDLLASGGEGSEIKKLLQELNRLLSAFDADAISGAMGQKSSTGFLGAEIKKTRGFGTPSQSKVYKYQDEKLLPSRDTKLPLKPGTTELPSGEKVRMSVEANVKDLTNSLLDLQKYIVNTLDKGFAEAESNWAIVRRDANQPISEYFKLTEGFNKKTAGKQYSVKIADVAGLQRALGGQNVLEQTYGLSGKQAQNPLLLIEKFKEKTFSDTMRSSANRLPELIGNWVKRFSFEDITTWKNLDKTLRDRLGELKKQYGSGKGTAPSQKLIQEIGKFAPETLEDIYRNTINEVVSAEKLTTTKAGDYAPLVREVSIPAAAMSSTGSTIFETQQGSQRIIPKFAKYQTGFENLYGKLADTGTLDVTKEYHNTIRGLGIRQTGTQYKKANEVAYSMLSDLASSDDSKVREDILKQYKTASVLRVDELARQKQITDPSAHMAKIEDTLSSKTAQDFAAGKIGFEELYSAMNKVGVSALDVAKSMESVEFKNIYQMFEQLLKGSDDYNRALEDLAKNPNFDASIREFETYLNKLVGTIPIADPSRPRRYAHQEKVINLMSMTSPIFQKGSSEMTSDEQKQYIRDLNLNLREFVKETEVLNKAGITDRKLPADVRTISSLGVPESQAASLKEYRPGYRSDDAYLSSFNATALKMYTDVLPELSPFGAQFQQLGRNIASTTNAMAFRPAGRIGTDFPALRSSREQEMIEGGRYGDQGYGFNVIAELRNTASTFEDQILISGKLADVLTSVTKTLVQPDKLGKLQFLAAEGAIGTPAAGQVEDIEAGKILAGLENANRVFQEVLGVKQEYRGRADQALIKEVEKAITVVRGQKLNVQVAKIAETFFNYYGRKFTTRYGSKGVSIAPTGQNELTGKEVAKLFDKPVKVLSEKERETAGLGSAVLPKSMGELLREVFLANRSDLTLDRTELAKLNQEMVASGNKFMLSMFTDASLGVVPTYEAEAQQILFEKVNKALGDLNLSIGKDVGGIKNVKELYKEQIGKPEFKEVPIDIRISSYGAAKRGLQTENLEAIMNNVVSAGASGATVLNTEFDSGQKSNKEVYQSLLGTAKNPLFPSLSEISAALGYESAPGSKKEIADELFTMLKERGTKGTDEELRAQAEKLAELEKKSSFYSKTVDEFGKARQSFVGPKFVEVVEDPNANPPWSETDIEKQIKGERLNLPAFGAYATIFGQDSAFMKQMSSNIPLDTKKNYEYVKALQMINDSGSEMASSLLKAAERLDVKDLKTFVSSTGTFDPASADSAGSLLGTILDTKKYPGAVNLQIPNTRLPAERESFYIPSALARTTYPEPTMAGEYGLDNISRRIQQVVNAAKDVDAVLSGEATTEATSKTVGRIKKRLGNLRKEVEGRASTGVVGGKLQFKDQLTPDDINRFDEILRYLNEVLAEHQVDPSYLTSGMQQQTRAQYIEGFKNIQFSKAPPAEAWVNTINAAVDQLIGLDPKGKEKAPDYLKPRYEAATPLSKAEDLGGTAVKQLAGKLKIEPAKGREDALAYSVQKLEKAKIEYYNALAQAALGKTGAVQELMFTRKVPAVMGKAINAVVDKTSDLEKFSAELLRISQSSSTGVDLSSLMDASKKIEKIGEEHAKTIGDYKAKGLPVLKQHELGVPEEYAKKLPVTFPRKFALNAEGGVTQFKSVKNDKSNLSEMMKYRDQMLQALDANIADSLKATIQEHIKQDLTPYIESVRYPFTGISSVQPYEAKILRPGKGRQLEKHSLMAPGIPEMDLAGFDQVKKQVESKLEELYKALDIEQAKESPDSDRVNSLIKTIGMLDKAISDVIPKYIAQQQKLDFDGDQIEIHSAKTVAARKEIEQHFKSLTEHGFSKGTTAQAFRDQFTYDALVPSTGKYTLAEQQLAFQKKFPEKEGFGFLSKPFLTEQLEYLEPKERLGILAGVPGGGGTPKGPYQAIADVLPEVFRNQDTIDSILQTMKAVEAPLTAEGTVDESAYITALLDAIRTLDNNILSIVNEGIKSELFDTKYLNTISAQLFKINTGPDTEALNRLLKLFERNAGFGGGVVGAGQTSFNFSDDLKKRFPTDLNVLGDAMGEELNTMINELVRVGIQKGLDVKHAGEIPIATEITQLISQGQPGVESLLGKIKEGSGAYGDIQEFAEANTQALSRNLSKLSNEELFADAVKIGAGRGDSAESLMNLDRQQLKEYITEAIGFEGFLQELSREVFQAAYEGIMEELAGFDPNLRQKKLQGRTPEQYAKEEISKQLQEEGQLNVLASAERPLLPLYKYRTSGASGYQQRQAYRKKYGDPQVPELSGIFDEDKSLKDNMFSKYKEAKAVAQNLHDDVTKFSSSERARRGSYDYMLESTLDNLRNDQAQIDKLNKQLETEGDYVDTDVVSRLSGQSPMNSLTKEILSTSNNKERKKLLEKYSRQVGAPGLKESTVSELTSSLTPDVAEYIHASAPPAPKKEDYKSTEAFKNALGEYNKELTDTYQEELNKAIAIVQTDIIYKTAKTKKYEGEFLQGFAPKRETSFAEKRDKLDRAAALRLMESSTGTRDMDADMMTAGMAMGTTPPGGAAQMLTGGGGKPVDVFVVGVAQGVGLLLGQVEGLAQTTRQTPARTGGLRKDGPLPFGLEEKVKEAERILNEAAGRTTSTRSSDLSQMYKASALHGVQNYEKQVEEIMKTMVGEFPDNHRLKSSSLLGTAIHSKLDPIYENDPVAKREGLTVGIEEPIKRYIDPVAGEISGIMDVVQRDNEGLAKRIIDIKTTSEIHFNNLRKAIEAFRESTGKETPSLEEIKPYVKGDRYWTDSKLDEVASQLNLYLKAENENAEAYANFYSATNTDYEKPLSLSQSFDPKRLDKDVNSIKLAREKVQKAFEEGKGKPFAPASSYEDLQKIERKQLEKEDLDRVLATATEYYKLVQNNQGLASSKTSLDDEELNNLAANTRKQKARVNAFDDMIRVMPVAEGSGIVDIQRALTEMHQMARSFQRNREQGAVSIDEDGLKEFHSVIQDQIKKIVKTGPAGHTFSDELTKLKDQGAVTYPQITKAWKAYRIAVGDYYIRKIEEAEAGLKDESVKPGSDEQVRRFENYKGYVKRFQAYARDNLGKATDIYTHDKRYITPEASRRAGVMLSTEDLVKRSSDALGEDRDLRALFTRMVDFGEEETPLPRDAVRDALTSLLGMDKALVDLYTDLERVIKLGPQITEAFKFTDARSGISRLREQLEVLLSYDVKGRYSPEQIKYLKNVLGDLRAIENVYSRIDFNSFSFEKPTNEHVIPDLLPVSKHLNVNEQNAINNLNLNQLEKYFATPESKGGARKGETFNYEAKTFGPAGRTATNQRFSFIKYGDVMKRGLEGATQETAVFDKKMKDLGKTMAEGNRTFSIAIERVIKWGSAAALVYGGVRYIREAIDHISDVEVAIARLQMVMNPLETDFDNLKKSAISFAKEYGVSVESVLAGMRIFAQQGLGQEEVVSRTRTSVVASNITDLSAADATEALTAAMKVFNTETVDSMRYLDAWSNVESQAAVTAGNLADAIKKAASAAKNAGIDFDELNGMVAAIGSVTRQTGKEVGTSLRFIFRRLGSDKGPTELRKQGIEIINPETGALREGFDILDELAGKWDDLGRAQKLSIAQAIGGTRQYNSVLVLLDNWDEVLRNLGNSMDSKGAAERKNLVLMKTYAKQLEQTKATFSELKLEIGKLVLPSFKTALTGIRGVLEVINDIPPSIKLLGSGFLLFTGYLLKGADMVDYFMHLLDKSKITFNEFKGDIAKDFKIGLYEVFKAGDPAKNSDLFGVSSIKDGQISSISQLESAVGKLGFGLLSAGRTFNEFLGIVASDTGAASEAVGGFIKKIGDLIQKAGVVTDVAGDFIPGPIEDAIGKGMAVTGSVMEYSGGGLEKVGEIFGDQAQSWLENFAASNSSALKSLGPLIGALGALTVLAPKLKDSYTALTKSAEDYKKTQYASLEVKFKEIESIAGLVTEIGKLEKAYKKISKLADPKVQAKGIKIGEYKSPLLAEISYTEQLKKLRTQIATTDSSLVTGFDEFGGPILSMDQDVNTLKAYLTELERVKKVQLAMSKVNVAGKFVEELTQTDGLQEWKSQLKELGKLFPVIGQLISEQIVVGPKKALEEINNELTKLTQAKSENPLSTAFDADIKTALDAQQKVLKQVASSYEGMKNELANISTKGLLDSDIQKIFSSKELSEAYDLIAKFETKYNTVSTKGKVTGQDVFTSTILKATKPELANYIEPLPELTIAKLLEAGRNPRNLKGGTTSVKSGDFAVFTKDFADKYAIATEQATIKIDDANNMFVDYINKYTGHRYIREVSQEEIENSVVALFPTDEIIRGAEDQIAKLNTFVTGASAGILGLSSKNMKDRRIDLGEKFFSEIPTDVLLQTNKGYNPVTGTFGDQAYKENYAKEFEKFLFDPFTEYSGKLTELRAPGSELDAGVAGAMGERLQQLQDILKNNSVVFQYRTALEDLMKTMEAGNRQTAKNIALEKQRQEIDKVTGGLLAGTTRGVTGIDYGVYNIDDLTPEQSAVRGNAKFTDNAKQILIIEQQLEGAIQNAKEVISTLSDVQEIGKAPAAFGSVLSADEIKAKQEEILKTGGDKGAAEVSLKLNAVREELIAIKDNTSILARKAVQPPTEVISAQNKLNNYLNQLEEAPNEFKSYRPRSLIAGQLETVNFAREKALKEGNVDLASNLEAYLNKTYSRLLKGAGLEEFNKVFKGRKISGETAFGKAVQGAGISKEALLDRVLEKGGPSVVKSEDLLNKYFKTRGKATGSGTPFFNLDEIGKYSTAAAIFSTFQKKDYGDRYAKVEGQLNDAQARRKKLRGSNASTTQVDAEIAGYEETLQSIASRKNIFGVMQGLTTTVAATKAAANKGFLGFGADTDAQKKLIGAAVGIYSLVKLAETQLGKETFAYAKEFGDAGKKAALEAYNSGEAKDVKGVFDKANAFISAFLEDERLRSRFTGKTDKEVGEKVAKERTNLADLKTRVDAEAAKDTINKKLDATDSSGLKFVRQSLAAIVGAGVFNYLTNTDNVDTRIADDKVLAEKEQKELMKYFNANKDQVDKIIGDIFTAREQANNVTGITSPTAYDNSFLSAADEMKRILEKGGSVEEAFKAFIKNLQSQANSLKVDNAVLLSLETLKKKFNDLEAGLRSTITTFDTKRLFNPVKSVGNALKGFGGELELPLLRRDMSAGQRMFADASPATKEAIITYQKLNMALETHTQAATEASLRMATLESNLEKLKQSGQGNSDMAKAYGKELDTLKMQFKKTEAITKKLSDSSGKLSESLLAMQKYKEAIMQLNDALADISVNNYVQSAAGLKDYFKMMENLPGGSGLLAPVSYTPEEERRSQMVGEPFNFNTNALDKERVDLLYERLFESPDTNRQADIDRELANIQDKFRYAQEFKDRDTEYNALRESNAPVEKLFADLEKFRRSVPLNAEQGNQIDTLMKQINQSLLDSKTEITVGDKIKELEAKYAGRDKDQFYISQMEQLTKLKPEQKMLKGSEEAVELANNLSLDKSLEEAFLAYKQSAGIVELTSQSIYEPIVKEIVNFENLIKTYFSNQRTAEGQIPGTARPLPVKEYDSMPPSVFKDALAPKVYQEPTKENVEKVFSDLRMSGLKPSDSLKSNREEAISTPPIVEKSMWQRVMDLFTHGRPASAWGEKDKEDKMIPYPGSAGSRVTGKEIGIIAAIKEQTDVIEKAFSNDTERKPAMGNNMLSSYQQLNGQRRQSGGRIFGEGGPREDKIPAYLSPGEFVIRAHSAQRIGYSALDHMNKKGYIPTFGDGGNLSEQHIKAAQNYFNNEEAELPAMFDPESKKFDKGLTAKYVELYKKGLPPDYAKVINATTLKGLYNQLIDLNDEAAFLSTKSIMSNVPKEDDGGFSFKKGWKAFTSNSREKLIDEITKADGGTIPNDMFASHSRIKDAVKPKSIDEYLNPLREVDTRTSKYTPTVDQVAEGQAKARHTLRNIASFLPLTNAAESAYGLYESINRGDVGAHSALEPLGVAELLKFLPYGGKTGKVLKGVSKYVGGWLDNTGDALDISAESGYMDKVLEKLGKKGFVSGNKSITGAARGFADGMDEEDVRSFIGGPGGITEVGSKDFDSRAQKQLEGIKAFEANKAAAWSKSVFSGKAYEDKEKGLNLWGNDTATGVHERILTSKLLAKNDPERMKRKATEAQNFYKEMRSLSGYNPTHQSLVDYSIPSLFKPYTSNPNSKRGNIITPGAPETVGHEDLFNFFKKLSPKAPSELAEYHEKGRQIQAYMGVLEKNALGTKTKLGSKYFAQAEALNKVKAILGIAESGGNIFNDPSLHKSEFTDRPYPLNYNGIFGFQKERTDTSYLEDVKKAYNQAMSVMRPKQKITKKHDFPLRPMTNGGSLSVFHNGGVIPKTGPVFAEKGELIVPKKFADGTTQTLMGQTSNKSAVADKALRGSFTVTVDGSDLISKLSKLTLDVKKDPIPVDIKSLEDLELKVEDRELRVADTELKLETTEVSLNLGEAESKLASAITSALEGIPTAIAFDSEGASTALSEAVANAISTAPALQVEEAHVTLDTTEVTLNIGDAESRLANAITSAISNATVEVSAAAGPESAGSAAFDLVEKFKDQFVTATVKIEDKVTELEGRIDNVTNSSQLDSKMEGLSQDVQTSMSALSRLDDKVTSYINRAGQELAEATRLARQSLNFTGTGL